MAQPRVIVTGGGSEMDSLPLDRLFYSWLNLHSSILYLPIAMQDPQGIFESSWEWFTHAFAPFNLTNIHMWTTLADKTAQDLNTFDAVFIGGGNTYWLLHQLRATGLDAALIDFIQQGHPVSGGSAGAILLGRDIQTCAHMDPNTIGLTDMRGLDMMLGYAIWCHYTPDDDRRILAYIGTHNIQALALTERAGIYRDGGRLFAGGYDPVLQFSASGRAMFSAGECITPAPGFRQRQRG
jgi:dipeptidase E